ncbi:MAG: Bax inhibitor-1/YccA family protein [Fournierella sp.]|uniref:Bax inhibitor-1/YccA family protein n=1 Tax=Allofournierella sp. TaxID=1940256 RepID=UPI002A82EE8D|nr:Bax inhibitor-1/YccA family protein [Fournierella sp.]MDY4166206.1 Bax inhibitor-1/YccA family protein [Fournierella sp.]
MNDYNQWNNSGPNTVYMNEKFQYETLSNYTAKTFLWMFAGLLVTFGVSLAAYMSNIGFYLLRSSFTFFGLAILEIVLVMALVSRLHSMSVGSARALFFVYAAVNGLVFSSYLWLYNMGDVLMAFGAAALYFGVMAAYGYLTKRDLTSWRTPLMVGLIVLMIVSVIGMFFMSGSSILFSVLGIVIFSCYTAYDTQKIKALYFAYAGNEAMAKKASIFAALQLYLDFINLFLYLLRIFGRSRD